MEVQLLRSASSGSIRMARRAGPRMAIIATRAMPVRMTAMLEGSVGRIPGIRMMARGLAIAMASARPMMLPSRSVIAFSLTIMPST